MSRAPLVFELRFRWAILRQMEDLHAIASPVDPAFPKLYAAIRDAAWEAAQGQRSEPLDPAKIELPQVQYYLHTTIESIRATMVSSTPGGGP